MHFCNSCWSFLYIYPGIYLKLFISNAQILILFLYAAYFPVRGTLLLPSSRKDTILFINFADEME